MKQLRLSMILLLVLTMLASCGAGAGQLTEYEGERVQAASEFVLEYKEQLLSAINEGDFNQLEPYVIANTSFYHSLRRYISDQRELRVEIELVEFTVERLWVDEHNQLYVDVKEVVNVTNRETVQEETSFVRYDLLEAGERGFLIETIRDRGEPTE